MQVIGAQHDQCCACMHAERTGKSTTVLTVEMVPQVIAILPEQMIAEIPHAPGKDCNMQSDAAQCYVCQSRKSCAAAKHVTPCCHLCSGGVNDQSITAL